MRTDSDQVAVVFKMDMRSNLKIFTDKERQNLALHLKMEDMIRTEWLLEDTESGGAPLARVKMNRFKSMAGFGKEDFTIKHPDGSEWMTLETDSSLGKHILDNMTALYNPSHHYEVKSSGVVVARILTKAGFFHQRYDFELVGGSEPEKKVALAVFAVIALMLRK